MFIWSSWFGQVSIPLIFSFKIDLFPHKIKFYKILVQRYSWKNKKLHGVSLDGITKSVHSKYNCITVSYVMLCYVKLKYALSIFKRMAANHCLTEACSIRPEFIVWYTWRFIKHTYKNTPIEKSADFWLVKFKFKVLELQLIF